MSTQSQNPLSRLASERLGELLRSGYLFASKMRRRAGVSSDSETPVEFPLLGRRTVLLRGKEGVEAFYDPELVERTGAMPEFVSGPLFGKGAVHGLDGTAHSVRKQAMADLAYEDEEVARFIPLIREEMESLLAEWREGRGGNVYDDTAKAFGLAAFRWAGIPAERGEMARRAEQMSRLLDTFGRFPTNPVAWFERRQLDAWAAGLIEQTRSGSLAAPEGSTLARVAEMKDESGQRLDARTAGIELQNLTRPTVAVSRFAAFAAVALAEHPEWRERIREAAAERGVLTEVPEAVAFAQEVRRVYPFVPMLPGLARKDATVQGCPVSKGDRLLIDILGTNTGAAGWEDAESFNPERFMGVENAEEIADFIPQGGASVRTGHRCPGEKIAVSALSTAVAALSDEGVSIAASPEDRTFSWTTILTRPSTGVRIGGRSAQAPQGRCPVAH